MEYSKDKKMQVVVRINSDLDKSIRIIATNKNLTLSELIRNSLENTVVNNKKADTGIETVSA